MMHTPIGIINTNAVGVVRDAIATYPTESAIVAERGEKKCLSLNAGLITVGPVVVVLFLMLLQAKDISSHTE
ncbi:MAG: hypothetical protein NVS4B12_29290 [Ktedonobacteraceae bacterium]